MGFKIIRDILNEDRDFGYVGYKTLDYKDSGVNKFRTLDDDDNIYFVALVDIDMVSEDKFYNWSRDKFGTTKMEKEITDGRWEGYM